MEFKIKKDKEGKTISKQKIRLNLLPDNLTAKFKTIMIGTRATGATLSRRIVMTVRDGVVKSNNLILLKENGGSLQLTED